MPGSADLAVSESLYLSDPDGLGIKVYADRPQSSWTRLESGQLYMTTERLDIRGVLAAGGTAPWTGMPTGTVIGHVHLSVGNLAAAAGFYHQGLGFDKVVWSFAGALFMSAGGYHHHLGTNTWSSGPPATDEDARLLSWTVLLPSAADVAAAGRASNTRGTRCTLTAARSRPPIRGARFCGSRWGSGSRVNSQLPTSNPKGLGSTGRGEIRLTVTTPSARGSRHPGALRGILCDSIGR